MTMKDMTGGHKNKKNNSISSNINLLGKHQSIQNGYKNGIFEGSAGNHIISEN